MTRETAAPRLSHRFGEVTHSFLRMPIFSGYLSRSMATLWLQKVSQDAQFVTQDPTQCWNSLISAFSNSLALDSVRWQAMNVSSR